MTKKVNRKKLLRKQWKDANRQSKVGSEVKEVNSQESIPAVATSLEDFLALPELAGLPAERLKTFYEEGIQSVADFANWTEKDLLALKGIGPATLKKLAEQGISFKK